MTRPEVLTGQTHKIRISTADGEYSFYVTINSDPDGNPYEIFINCKAAQYAEHMTALTLMVSRLLQVGVDLKVIAEDLCSIQSSVTGYMMKGGLCPSLYARIGKVLSSVIRS